MNTQTLTIAGLVLAASAITPLTHAEDGWFFKPYVGVDVEYVNIDYQSVNGVDLGTILAEEVINFNGHVGARLHKHLGIEVGYSQSTSENESIAGVDTEVELSGFNVDALGYLPITKDRKLELIGTAGITVLEGSLVIPGSGAQDDETDTTWRVGTGLNYKFTDNFSARALVRYTDVDFDDVADNLVSFGIGVNYQF